MLLSLGNRIDARRKELSKKVLDFFVPVYSVFRKQRICNKSTLLQAANTSKREHSKVPLI